MRILIEGQSYKDYLAKCHEAFRTGLQAMFDARCYGKGYPGYDSRGPRSYTEIIKRVFGETIPDLIISDSYFPYESPAFKYEGLAEVQAVKSFMFGDFWDINENHHESFVRFVEQHKIDLIISYFTQPFEIWSHTPIAKLFIHVPASFDPCIFNDWKMPKTHDVGFLAAGTTEFSKVYPERFSIHQKLLQQKNLKYLWAQHPGWQPHENHPLVGRGFSKAINSCRLFITTSGTYNQVHAKYVEIMASRSLLMADEPKGGETLHLKDGVNYVRISEHDVMDKVHWYLNHPDVAEEIADAGYRTAMRFHNCYARAVDFYEAARKLRPDLGLAPDTPSAPSKQSVLNRIIGFAKRNL